MFAKEATRNDDFYHHFQPIYDIQSNSIVGYEGLFRSRKFPSPETAFHNARKERKLYELDSRSIHKASQEFFKSGSTARFNKLFLNVFPSTLLNPDFKPFIEQIIEQNSIISQQLILEINEDETMNFSELKSIIQFLKTIGISIAIDDFGKGSSTSQSIIEINPDYIKLDRYFLNGISNSKQKMDIIDFVFNYCSKYNIGFVPEGVEDKEGFEFLKDIGVKLAQGYFLGKPDVLA